MEKQTSITLYCTEAEKDAIKKAAVKEMRSLSNYCLTILLDQAKKGVGSIEN